MILSLGSKEFCNSFEVKYITDSEETENNEPFYNITLIKGTNKNGEFIEIERETFRGVTNNKKVVESMVKQLMLYEVTPCQAAEVIDQIYERSL